MQNIEEWRPIEGWPYEVSSLGRVRNARNGYIKKPTIARVGYPVVNLSRGGHVTQEVHYVHNLVCTAFHGPKPSPRHEVAHWDGDKTNCRATNLRWVLPAENAADRIRHGTHRRGSRCGCAKLTEHDIVMIRDACRNGARTKDIAARYGVRPGHINNILRGKIWAHVGGAFNRPRSDGALKGEAAPRSKLTEQEVLEIRRQTDTGANKAALARRYGVTRSTITGIAYGWIWKHILTARPQSAPITSKFLEHKKAFPAQTSP